MKVYKKNIRNEIKEEKLITSVALRVGTQMQNILDVAAKQQKFTQKLKVFLQRSFMVYMWVQISQLLKNEPSSGLRTQLLTVLFS